MDELLVALAGGAIGTLLLGVAWAVLRTASIPGDLDRHDEVARVLNEDLELWVADDYRALQQEDKKITHEMNRRNQFYSGAHGVALAEAKTRKLHAYRDRLHESERKLADVQAQETWAHGLARKLLGRPPLELTAARRVESVLEQFRSNVGRHGGRVEVHDPTQFRLDDLLDEIRRAPLPTIEQSQAPEN